MIHTIIGELPFSILTFDPTLTLVKVKVKSQGQSLSSHDIYWQHRARFGGEHLRTSHWGLEI